MFDLRLVPVMEKQIEANTQLNPLANPLAELSEEWIAYLHCVSRETFRPGLDLAEYWRSLSVRFPKVAGVVYIYFPVSSVNCERSFSKYKTTQRSGRHSLS